MRQQAHVATATAKAEQVRALAVEKAARARENELKEEHTRAEAKLRQDAWRDLQRRTGALAEQHAQAMRDKEEAHEEQMRDTLRQLRLTPAMGPRDSGATSANVDVQQFL